MYIVHSLNIYNSIFQTAEHYLVTVGEDANVTGDCAANKSSLVLTEDAGTLTMLFDIVSIL